MKNLAALIIVLTLCICFPTTNFMCQFAYGEGIVAFKKETVSNPYGREKYSIIRSTANLKSVPTYNENDYEVGRKIRLIDKKGNPKTLVKIYSDYQWHNGQLTRKVEDKLKNETYNEVLDTEGRVAQELRNIEKGRRISISYNWEGGTNRCNSAKALLNGTILGEARVVDIGGNEEQGHYQLVEEIHYAPDRGSKIIYKAKSKFGISYLSVKIEEKQLSGKKIYELFNRWGRVE